jgi:hypothetical protein
MENIKAFLDAVEKYGLAKEDTFVTVDLFEGRNMKQVLSYSMVVYFQADGYTIPFPEHRIGSYLLLCSQHASVHRLCPNLRTGML